jgi:selenium metabolism protein YedF
MSEVKLECQGLPCPQPVLKCKDALIQDQPDSLVVLVDNEPARENVTRFLKSRGYAVVSHNQNNGFIELKAQPEGAVADEPPARDRTAGTEASGAAPGPAPQEDKQLVLITSNVIGHGDEELGARLMHNYIATLPEMGASLWRILLLNSGVKLAVEGSQDLENLQKIEKSGVSILVCGTCLDHFQLLEHKRVGQTTNMLDVVTSLQLASKVITI